MKEEKKKNTKVDEKGRDHLHEIRRILDEMESNISRIKHLLFAENFKSQLKEREIKDGETEVVEGVFDGENMIDRSSKKYLVPANYASKSKLVCGDVLKLTMPKDGPFIFKQIGPVERRNTVGVLDEADGKYYVVVDNKKYNVLLASITYFKAKVGDKLAVILPKDENCDWTAIENII